MILTRHIHTRTHTYTHTHRPITAIRLMQKQWHYNYCNISDTELVLSEL